MKSYFLLLVISITLITFACKKNKENPAPSNDYPSIIDEYIALNYAGFTTYNVELEAGREYEVTLCDGNILVFDLSGIFMRERLGGEPFGDPANCPDSLLTRADLALIIRVKNKAGNNVSSVKKGEEFTYEIIVSNAGPANASSVNVTSVFPVSNLEFIASDGFYDEFSSKWKVGAIAKGTSQKLVITAKGIEIGGTTLSAEVMQAEPKDSDSPHGNGILEEDDQYEVAIGITE